MTFNEVMGEIKTSGKKYTNDQYTNGECIYYVPEKIDEETNEKEADYIAFREVTDKENKLYCTYQYMASMYDIYTNTWRVFEGE